MRAKARVSARATSAASTRRAACKHAAELHASTQRTRAARRRHATRTREGNRGEGKRRRADRLGNSAPNVSPFQRQLSPSACGRDHLCPGSFTGHISSKDTPPSGKYETIISKIFLKGYCLSERCATYVVFRLVFLRGPQEVVCSS